MTDKNINEKIHEIEMPVTKAFVFNVERFRHPQIKTDNSSQIFQNTKITQEIIPRKSSVNSLTQELSPEKISGESFSEYESTKIDSINKNLSYEEMFLLSAKRAEINYIQKIESSDPIILKQTISKFFLTPEAKLLTLKSQNFLKNFAQNTSEALKSFKELPKKDAEKLIETFYTFVKGMNNNTLIAPKSIRELSKLILKNFQASFFANF